MGGAFVRGCDDPLFTVWLTGGAVKSVPLFFPIDSIGFVVLETESLLRNRFLGSGVLAGKFGCLKFFVDRLVLSLVGCSSVPLWSLKTE